MLEKFYLQRSEKHDITASFSDRNNHAYETAQGRSLAPEAFPLPLVLVLGDFGLYLHSGDRVSTMQPTLASNS